MTELAGEQPRRPDVVWTSGFACDHYPWKENWDREPKEVWRLDPKDHDYSISDKGRRRFLPPQVGCG